MFSKIYKTIIIDFSKISIVLICSVLAYFLYFSKDFKLDASSDSLLLESDKDLKYLREVNERYGSKDYLVLTYTPTSTFTDEETIINLQFLRSKIDKLEWVDRVITIIDVPLFKSSWTARDRYFHGGCPASTPRDPCLQQGNPPRRYRQ